MLAEAARAAVRPVAGVCYLYMKTIERAHSPRNLWERIKLSRNFEKVRPCCVRVCVCVCVCVCVTVA